MSRLARVLATGVAVAAMLCALPARSLASSTETSMLMDDDQLIYVGQQHMTQTLERLASLGVDVVKVSVVWQLIAPSPFSSQRPHFDATDPTAYPHGAWNRYDELVETAQKLGMKVYFLLIGPAPNWAIPRHLSRGQGPLLGFMPNPTDYRNFVEAVGRRYSGAYVDPTAASDPPPVLPGVGAIDIPGVTPAPQSAPAPQPLPRVSYWGIWNEPNERSWLNPWYRPLAHNRKAYIQPEEYRALVDAAWSGLSASDHASDTVMVGETANRGVLTPRQFVRGLYCVGANLRPLRGTAASNVGCPSSGNPSDFLSAHPGLFESAGYSHHPYAFDVPPNHPYPDRAFITLDNLPSFDRLLDGIFATYGVHPAGGVPLYLTEWGYKTNPPNPYVKTTEAEQAAWLNQGEYMTWRYPFVRALTQFLLVDSPPKQGERKGTPLYWSTFQTGLELQNGQAKPSLTAFRIPIWLPVARHGPSADIWGQLRPANHTATQTAYVEFIPRGTTRWTQLAQVQTTSPEGFLSNHVAIPSAGELRLAWPAPNGSVYYSRTVAIS